MPLARADFWGNRDLLERAGEREARAAFEVDSGARGAVGALAERRVLRAACGRDGPHDASRVRGNRRVLRRRLHSRRAAPGARERRHVARASGDVARGARAPTREPLFFGVHRCRRLFRDDRRVRRVAAERDSEKIQYVKGIARGFASDASVQALAAEAAAQFEHVRRIFASFARVCVASLVACLALAAPARQAARPGGDPRALPVLGVPRAGLGAVLLHAPQARAERRHVISASRDGRAERRSVEHGVAVPPEYLDANRARPGRGAVHHDSVLLLVHDAPEPARTRALPRARRVRALLAGRERDARGRNLRAARVRPGGGEKWRAWRAVAAFVVVVCAADWRHARQIFPRALRRRVAAALFPGRKRAADPRPGDPETDSRAGRRDGIFSSVLCRS